MLKRIAFFIRSITNGYENIFPELMALTPDSKHIATLGITEKRFKEGDYRSELDEFITQVK